MHVTLDLNLAVSQFLLQPPQALKMPIDHLEQPCALFAVYDGHMAGSQAGTLGIAAGLALHGLLSAKCC